MTRMPAHVHLLSGPARSGKTRRLRERCRQLPPGSALWIGPEAAALEETRRGWLIDGAALILPRLLTFADLADALVRRHDPAAQPISDVHRCLMLDALLGELRAAGALTHFEAVIETRGFSNGIEAWLSELKEAEVWPRQLARAAYGRDYRGSEAGRSIGRRSIRRKDRQLVRLYARYQYELRRQSLIDREGMLWHARDLLTRGQRAPFEAIRAVFVDDFVRFSRTQIEMLHALASTVEEMWITLPDEAGDDRAELFARSRQTRARLAAGSIAFEASHIDASVSNRPAGLAHIERQLFRPLRTIVPSADASGLLLLAGPGKLGEARLVARQVKQLLLDGVAGGDIVVALRDLEPYADLLDEVFSEYGIPLALDGSESLARNPAVAFLLRARRLAEDNWPFAGVAALLRATYLRPDWPEAGPNVPTQAETLLRLLGEPAGQDAYLAGIQRWIDQPPPPLEDEEDFPRRRQLIHELAQRCQAFLRRFFQAWEGQPDTASVAEHVGWLRRLATELGLHHTARGSDRQAVALLFAELDRLESATNIDAARFARRLTLVSQTAGMPRSPGGPGRVRILPANQACHLDISQLFIMGLGEGSFPDLSAPDPIFDEAERQAFQRAGLDLPPLRDRMSEEMLLFYRLVTRPRDRLVLSYPAVDEQGQDLLPGSFLAALLASFQPDAVEPLRRRLLIEGYANEEIRSPTELRVHAARCGQVQHLPPDLAGNLAAAAELAECRFRRPSFSAYDGLLSDAAIRTELGRLFGPQRIFSPTALEDYAACPFRFFMRYGVRVEPLQEPGEEIVQTARGLLVHRALARLHRQLQKADIHQPQPDLIEELHDRLDEAVREHSGAAGPAARELWRLEGIRLQRWLRRYPGHWQKYLAPWQERSVTPRPQAFEVAFGSHGVEPLVIGADGVTVRIGGRIDRVDLAEIEEEIGFWIIDYKTGSAQFYRKGGDLDHLQLPLYALAVEEVVLAKQPARPLGLAYWMVAGSGCKLTLPAKPVDWLHDAEPWQRYRAQLKAWVQTLATHIRQGDFPLKPRSEAVCLNCDFGQVCRISQVREVVENKDWQLPLPVLDESRGA